MDFGLRRKLLGVVDRSGLFLGQVWEDQSARIGQMSGPVQGVQLAIHQVSAQEAVRKSDQVQNTLESQSHPLNAPNRSKDLSLFFVCEPHSQTA